MAIKSIAYHLVLSMPQVYQLCAAFPNPAVQPEQQRLLRGLTSAFQYRFENCRVEIFVSLFNRCNDPPTLCSHDCLHDASLFTQACVTTIRARLGYCRTFDALNCCQGAASAPPVLSRGQQPSTP